MLCRFKSRSIFSKPLRNFLQQPSAQFQSLNISIKKIFLKRNSNDGSKFFSSATIFQQGAEKTSKKFILHTISDYEKLPIKRICLNDDLDIMQVHFEEATVLEYPVVWLRDNCMCHRCFDPKSNSRIRDPLTFTSDIVPKSMAATEDSVSIIWEDLHHSRFPKDWLCRHSFLAEHQVERLNKDYIGQISWNAEGFEEIIPNICFQYDELITNERTLLKWMETLASVGITKISNVPQETGQLVKLSQRVSFIRKTHYGEEYYIRGEQDANNVAYQKGPLPMHTDLPYYQYVPGVVLLHYINQSSKGGENILADGLNAVKLLSRKTYDILATTLVDWLDIGYEKNNKFYSMYRAPVICENYSGGIERINWSHPQRNSSFNVPPDRALRWYTAYKEFSSVIHDRTNAVKLKMGEGSILAFDNRRILHGRSDFADKRFLCGAYLDWDEIYSKIRVLRQSLSTEYSMST